MVFGVFDIFHPGHIYFLTEASTRCEHLTVVVARSEVVELLKKRVPRNLLEDRIEKIRAHNSNYNVIEGDETLGEWAVLRDNPSDIIFLGYDQQGIARELDRIGVEYEFIESHHPDKYKSSLL